MSPTVCMLLKGYPRLTETFIAQEIHALEQRGLNVRIYSMRHPTDTKRHPVHDQIRSVPEYLPEYLKDEPRRVWRAWRAVRTWPSYKKARSVWFKDLVRNPTPNRIRRFGQALVLAHELPDDVVSIHVHFLHTPASVARYCSILRGIPWTCSAHAKDVWTIPEWEKREKLEDCDWLVTCTHYNAEHLKALAPSEDRVQLVYHGLDFSRFPSTARVARDSDGSLQKEPVRLLTVCRAVEKKGHAGLLRALASLPDDLNWTLAAVGGGDLLPSLKKQAEKLGLDDRIDWMGSLSQSEVIEQYHAADLFVLNSRIAKDGDRDGLPNVLMEAQSQGLACLSTDVAAVSELIIDGETGILIEPDNDEALATSLRQLIKDPALRERLALAGEERVRRDFIMDDGIDVLSERFGLTSIRSAA